MPSLPSWRGRLSFFSSVFPGFGGACPTGLGIWCLLFRVVAPFLVLGEVLSVFRVSWGLGAPCIVIGCCWAIALFGNKFLLIQKKKKTTITQALRCHLRRHCMGSNVALRYVGMRPAKGNY